MKKILFRAVYIAMVLIVIINLALFLKDQLFFNMNDLPTGDFLYSSMSPSGTKTLKMYYVTGVNGSGIRGELFYENEDGEVLSKNIYWSTSVSSAITGWMDDNILTINDYPLDIANGDTYDSRRKTSLGQKW